MQPLGAQLCNGLDAASVGNGCRADSNLSHKVTCYVGKKRNGDFVPFVFAIDVTSIYA